MKRTVFVCAFFTMALSGCQSVSDIDLSVKDSACGQICSTHYTTCDDRITMMPIRQHNDCADAFRYCVQACPPKGTSTATISDKASVTDRLKELDALHKNGLINDSEYATKRQEILKSM